MIKETTCAFDRREETLVAFVYGDIDAADRERFERHLLECLVCRNEVDALADVRADLGAWSSPEPALGVGGRTTRPPWRVIESPPANRTLPSPRGVSLWVQAAAAVLLCAVGLGAANLQISFSRDAGLSVRTGWLHPAPQRPADTAASSTGAPSVVSPWKDDLSTLEAQLRSELKAELTALDAADDDDVDAEALLRRVRALIAESERRQQRELALRVAEVAREAQVQRQADLVKIDRSLGLIQSRTGVEVMRTQQQLNSLAQRVSQRP